ncbi:hypothetical protein NE604_05515 [Anaerofustis stercorihominis]|uniref:Uncharacterized protein n=1 Tax=Anaerofustis stercorihominis DSM 17244 TaxID=445971 RepID=B1C9I9_9FIRM|nr:hypothetical protein [Anaerofustis stercorihominis]EDS72560.1 hypothetical protein ANASTE_02282 [Anaerofustis stercorihominis DSM 17244]MCQ4795096.1 hypothetical protein [Anaerofustis stercorihominis]
MKLYKKKRYNMFIMGLSVIGMMMYIISMFLRNKIADFPLGFIEGVSIVLMILGIIHMMISFINKRNPYSGEDMRHR